MTFIRKIKIGKRTYLAEVKSVRENGKVKQKFIKYLGTEIDGKPAKRVLTKDIRVKNVKRSLDVLCIDKIAKDLGITNINNKYFLSLIYSQLLEKRSIHKLEDWFRFTEIPELLNLKDISIKKLYESLTDVEENELTKIDVGMYELFKKIDDSKDAVVLDVTDTYLEGDSLDLKKRRGKDGKVRKLVQVGLATSFKYGFPIFHREYQGNLSNIQIFKDVSLELKERGLNTVIVDRGMMSSENLQMILNLQMKTIAGLKKTKQIVDNYLSKINRDDIYSLKNRVKLKNTTVFVQTFNYAQGNIIVVYNPALEVVKKELNFIKGEEIINKYIGYSLIYHNTEYDFIDVVRRYYDKEIIERAFKILKGILKLRPVRVWLENHIKSHIQICYFAYAILSLMNYHLQKLNISAVDALDSLKHGYKINLTVEKEKYDWSLYVPLEPNQKNILTALGVVYKN